MILNVADYRELHLPYVRWWIETNGVDQFTLTNIAQNRELHIVIVAYLMAELVGFTDEMKGHIKRLEEFYRIEGVTV